jgi:hypothetical protein
VRDLVQHIRFGMRLFLGKPDFTLLAVLMLALGIAANTTVFSCVGSILLRPFPGAADPDGRRSLHLVSNPPYTFGFQGRQ